MGCAPDRVPEVVVDLGNGEKRVFSETLWERCRSERVPGVSPQDIGRLVCLIWAFYCRHRLDDPWWMDGGGMGFYEREISGKFRNAEEFEALYALWSMQ